MYQFNALLAENDDDSVAICRKGLATFEAKNDILVYRDTCLRCSTLSPRIAQQHLTPFVFCSVESDKQTVNAVPTIAHSSGYFIISY